MTWTYSFHRFPDRDAFEAALAGWAGFDPARAAIDVMGILYVPMTGQEPADQALPPLPGWHVNLARDGLDLPADWRAAELHPASPSRVFA